MKDYLLVILLFLSYRFYWLIFERLVIVGLSFEQHGCDLRNILRLMDSTCGYFKEIRDASMSIRE